MEALACQIEVLTRKVDRMQMSFNALQANCRWCGGSSIGRHCQGGDMLAFDNMEYIGDQYGPQHDPYGYQGTFDFYQPPQSSPSEPPPQDDAYLEDLLARFITASDERYTQKEQELDNQWASIRNLENQVSQVIKLLTEEQQGNQVKFELDPHDYDEEMEEYTETTMDEVQISSSQSTVQVPPPVKAYNPPMKPKKRGNVEWEEVHPLPLPSHLEYFHPAGMYSSYFPHLISSVGNYTPMSCN